MEANTQILDTLLDAIATACAGNGSLEGYARSLFGYLIAIDFVLAILFNLLSFGPQSFIGQLVTKIMKYGFWIWLISNWGYIVNAFASSLNIAGTSLGSMGADALRHPSQIINMGYDLADPYFKYLTSFTSWTTIVGSFGVYAMAFLGAVAICIGFIILAFQVFITYVEFYISSALMLIFLPFGSNKFTSRFAENALGGVIAHGVKLMFLGAIFSITAPILNQLNAEFATTPSWQSIASATIAPFALAFLSWQAPSMAVGFMSGGPSLTASTMATNATGAGSAIMSGARGSMALASGSVKAGAMGAHMAGRAAGAGANMARSAAGYFGGKGGGGTSGGSGAAAMGNFSGLSQQQPKGLPQGNNTIYL